MLEVSLAALLRNISDVLNAARCHPKGTAQLALSKSTGGRPAYNITKEMIEQLGETGMNWTSIATCLGISDQTLYRRRIEFGVENNFTEITNEELDRQIQETLNLTPYSGEIYVRGSLKGRGMNVQRFRIRESLNRIEAKYYYSFVHVQVVLHVKTHVLDDNKYYYRWFLVSITSYCFLFNIKITSPRACR